MFVFSSSGKLGSFSVFSQFAACFLCSHSADEQSSLSVYIRVLSTQLLIHGWTHACE